jgi:single-strand DNA-binding protein
MTINNLVLIGNLVEAPSVDVTNNGAVRARFRIASTERRYDATTDSWQDGESVFIQVTCWRRLAQNVGNSLDKGDRVIVSGRLRQWIAEKDGVRRTVHEIEADAVGPDLQRAVATISRPRRPIAPEVATEESSAGVDAGDPFGVGLDDAAGPSGAPELGEAAAAVEPELAPAV